MTIADFIEINTTSIVADADGRITKRHLQHYEDSTPGVVTSRVATLLRLAIKSVRERRLDAMEKYMDQVANERHNAGFEIREVQSAINAIEEAIWKLVMQKRDPAVQVEDLGLVGTVFGAAKDALARRYASFAGASVALQMSNTASDTDLQPR